MEHHAALGRVAQASSDRATKPEVRHGQWLVVMEVVQGSKGVVKYLLSIFDDADADLARQLGAHVRNTADGERSSLTQAEYDAAVEAVVKEALFARRSLYSFCSDWRQLLAIDEAEAEPGSRATEPEEHPLVGTRLAQVPIAEVGDDGEIVYTTFDSVVIVEGPTPTSKKLVVRDPEGGTHKIPMEFARLYLASSVTPVSAESATAELLAILKQMPASSSPSLQPSQLCAAEFLSFTEAACPSPRFIERLRASTPGSEAYDLCASFIIGSIEEGLKGKCLGTVWPTDPSLLGAAIKERMSAGGLGAELERAAPVVRTRLPPMSKESAEAHPLATALRAACISVTEWSAFLKESIEFTTEPSRRTAAGSSEFRMMG